MYTQLGGRSVVSFGGRGARLWRHPGLSSANVTWFKALCAGGGNVTFGRDL